MADQNYAYSVGTGTVQKKLKDMGDGTFGEVVALNGPGTSAANPFYLADAYQAFQSVVWTSATAANTAATFTTSGYDTVIVTLATNAAFASGVVAFEVFDGVNWMPVKASNIANYTTTGATIAPAANTTSGYQVPVAGFPQFRVRLATQLSAGQLTVGNVISSAPDTSVVTVGLDPGTTHPVNPDAVTDAATQSASASSAATILTQSAVGFNGGSFRLSGTFTATVVLEGSDDGGTTWDALNFVPENVTSLLAVSTTATGLYRFSTSSAQVRLRVSAWTSGTVSAAIAMKRNAPPTLVTLGANYSQIGAVALSASLPAGIGVAVARITTGASGVIKVSNGKLYGLHSVINTNAAARYLQIYNKATAGIPGTDTPFMTIALTASQVLPPNLFTDIGISFGTGISWAITTDFAGATLGASGDIVFGANYI